MEIIVQRLNFENQMYTLFQTNFLKLIPLFIAHWKIQKESWTFTYDLSLKYCDKYKIAFILVMGPGQNFLPQVGSGQPFKVWVWISIISPKNVKFFNFFPSVSKQIASGQVRKYPGWSRIGLLFTAGQK